LFLRLPPPPRYTLFPYTTLFRSAWWNAIGHYMRNEDDQMPPAGRYNAGQKLLFWGFFWCSLLLLLTGAILWFPEYIPWSLRFLRSEEHTSELQSRFDLVCRLLLE